MGWRRDRGGRGRRDLPARACPRALRVGAQLAQHALSREQLPDYERRVYRFRRGRASSGKSLRRRDYDALRQGHELLGRAQH
jgi:hypothetical protein